MKTFGVTIAALLVAGCVDQAVDGRKAYMEDCAGCHGTDGKGAGEFGAQLIRVPPDLTHLSAGNGGAFRATG